MTTIIEPKVEKKAVRELKSLRTTGRERAAERNYCHSCHRCHRCHRVTAEK